MIDNFEQFLSDVAIVEEYIHEVTYEGKIPVEGELGSSNPTRALKALGQLKILFRSSVHSVEAVQKLSPIFKDAKLFKEIQDVAKDRPDSDIRNLVKFRLKQLGFTQVKYL